jgi:hypothetical protein
MIFFLIESLWLKFEPNNHDKHKKTPLIDELDIKQLAKKL